MNLIKSKLPGIYIHSIQIGSNMEEDIVNGFFKNANDQIGMACQMLTADSKLSGGFNAMGLSQVCVCVRVCACACVCSACVLCVCVLVQWCLWPGSLWLEL